MAASMLALAILKIGLSTASARALIHIALMILIDFCQREGLLVISAIVRSAIAIVRQIHTFILLNLSENQCRGDYYSVV